MPSTEDLRPIERAVRRMSGEGMSTSEIAVKLRKRPRTIELIEWCAQKRLDGEMAKAPTHGGPLTPLERSILRRLEQGDTYGVVGSRIMRSGAQVRRLEAYARFKLDGVWTAPPIVRPV